MVLLEKIKAMENPSISILTGFVPALWKKDCYFPGDDAHRFEFGAAKDPEDPLRVRHNGVHCNCYCRKILKMQISEHKLRYCDHLERSWKGRSNT